MTTWPALDARTPPSVPALDLIQGTRAEVLAMLDEK